MVLSEDLTKNMFIYPIKLEDTCSPSWLHDELQSTEQEITTATAQPQLHNTSVQRCPEAAHHDDDHFHETGTPPVTALSEEEEKEEDTQPQGVSPAVALSRSSTSSWSPPLSRPGSHCSDSSCILNTSTDFDVPLQQRRSEVGPTRTEKSTVNLRASPFPVTNMRASSNPCQTPGRSAAQAFSVEPSPGQPLQAQSSAKRYPTDPPRVKPAPPEKSVSTAAFPAQQPTPIEQNHIRHIKQFPRHRTKSLSSNGYPVNIVTCVCGLELRSDTLTRHQQSQECVSGKKSLIVLCPGCNKKFSRSDALTRHQKSLSACPKTMLKNLNVEESNFVAKEKADELESEEEEIDELESEEEEIDELESEEEQ